MNSDTIKNPLWSVTFPTDPHQRYFTSYVDHRCKLPPDRFEIKKGYIITITRAHNLHKRVLSNLPDLTPFIGIHR